MKSDSVWVSPNHGAGKLGTRLTASREDQRLTVIEFFNDRFIAADRDGRYKLSSDGFTWSGYQATENELPFFASAVGNGKVVFAQDSGMFAVTSDLENWSFSQPDPQANSIGSFNKDLVFFNGYFFTWTNSGKVLRSVDGIDWIASLDFDVEGTIRSVSAAAGIVLVVEVVGDFLKLHRSTDGFEWTSQDYPELQASRYSKAVGSEDLFILRAEKRYVSTDGQNWTLREGPPYTDQIRKMIKVGDIYYAALEDSVLMRSSDGLEWESVFDGPPPYSTGFAFGKDTFLFGSVGVLFCRLLTSRIQSTLNRNSLLKE